MQNNIVNQINSSTRILILLICCLITIIAKSIFLLIFISLFLIILMVLTEKSVKFYLNFVKEFNLLLLFIFIAYIILFGGIYNSFIAVYKAVLVIFFIRQFILTMNFQKFSNGMMTIINPIENSKLEKIVYDVLIFIYFILYFINSKKQILRKYSKNNMSFSLSLKYNLLPRIFLSMTKTKQLESSLKIKHFKASIEKKNKLSTITLYIFITIFMLVILKEVIL